MNCPAESHFICVGLSHMRTISRQLFGFKYCSTYPDISDLEDRYPFLSPTTELPHVWSCLMCTINYQYSWCTNVALSAQGDR